jgi:hypothetical protein
MTKSHRAVAPALQAAPSVVASVDSQIVRRQRVSPGPMAWDILPPDFAAIDMEEVDDRRTISTEHAPATTISIFSIEILRLQQTDSLPTLLRVETGAACSPSRRIAAPATVCEVS